MKRPNVFALDALLTYAVEPADPDRTVPNPARKALRNQLAEARVTLKALEQDPKTRWRVTETDWRHYKFYDRFRKVAELALRQTASASAPWIRS